jgi:hypothetical protein
MENTENVVQGNVTEVMQSFMGRTVDACTDKTAQDRIFAVRMKLFGIQAKVQMSDLANKPYSS